MTHSTFQHVSPDGSLNNIIPFPQKLPIYQQPRGGCSSISIGNSSGTRSRAEVCTDSRDCGPDGISSEDFPSWARSAFIYNAIVRLLSHWEATCHWPWTFPFVSQDLKSSQQTLIMTAELPDKMHSTIQPFYIYCFNVKK